MQLALKSTLALKSALALAGLAAVGLILPVHAGTNLVKDGDFEQADLGAPAGAEYAFFQGSPFDAFWSINDVGVSVVETASPYVLDGSKSLFLNAGSTVPDPNALSASPRTWRPSRVRRTRSRSLLIHFRLRLTPCSMFLLAARP